MNFDLHCHSTVSDGTLSPADVVARAAANGVTDLALTDHDAIDGLVEARDAARAAGIRLIDGVEISVTWSWQTVHIVGLAIDPCSDVLAQGLQAVRSSRHHRATAIADRLAQIDIHGTLEGAYRYAENAALISRTHFARHLVAAGHARDISDAFERYLSAGRPGYVPHQWAELTDAVAWIRASGGVAVLAHPGRYKVSADRMDALFAEFKAAGGGAAEVVTSSQSLDQLGRFGTLCTRHGLLASRGSDFHEPGEGQFDLGKVPSLPHALTPVWSALPARP